MIKLQQASWRDDMKTEFMDVTWSYITNSLQNAKSLKIFKDFVVQGQGLVNWSSRTRTFLEDYNTEFSFATLFPCVSVIVIKASFGIGI